MNNNYFEMPIGFSLSIGTNQEALKYFGNLDIDMKNKIKSYIQNCTDENDAKYRINNAIDCMSKGNISFLNNIN